MAGNWYWKRDYLRTYRSGRVGPVAGHYYYRETVLDGEESRPKRRSNACPYCNARIHTAQTKNGGWVHFEHGLSHLGTLHSCFTVGRGLSKRRASVIRDLFDGMYTTQDKPAQIDLEVYED